MQSSNIALNLVDLGLGQLVGFGNNMLGWVRVRAISRFRHNMFGRSRVWAIPWFRHNIFGRLQ